MADLLAWNGLGNQLTYLISSVSAVRSLEMWVKVRAYAPGYALGDPSGLENRSV